MHIAEGPFTCANALIQNNDVGPCGTDACRFCHAVVILWQFLTDTIVLSPRVGGWH